jgi:hypothetical protein
MKRPALNFTDADWERVERDALAWWAGELERPLVYLSVTGPLAEWPYAYMSNYPLDMPAHEVLDRYEPLLAAQHYYADAFPWMWINFGPGIVAGFLGANVHSVTSPSETVWFTPARPTDIRALSPVYDAENVWWKRVKELTAAAVERYGDRLIVGHTDLGGNLDILASLRGTETLLLDLVDHPDEVERLASQITGLWLRYYDELDAIIRPACRGTSCWTPLFSPGKTYMLRFLVHDLAGHVRALRTPRSRRLLRAPGPRLLPPGRQRGDPAPGPAALDPAIARHPVGARRRAAAAGTVAAPAEAHPRRWQTVPGIRYP